jgi:probable rRNA maturation factor
MDSIHYFFEDIEFKLDNSNKISSWRSDVISKEKYNLTSINYIFCSDEHLLKVNREYLSHDYYTDIITFNNSEADNQIEGDLFISIDRVAENAKVNNESFDKELNRVMIHGVLHLLGYNDKTKEEQIMMREKENAYLSLRKF